MIEYPSIIKSCRAPRSNCVAFAKFDGSNVRFKFTHKHGFNLFGSRRELIDESHKMLGGAVTIFKAKYAPQLEEFFHRDKLTRNEREVIVFGEYFGPKSYAGTHQVDDVKNVVIFDVMVGHKNRRFYKPFDFIDTFQSLVEIPPVLYTGNLTDQFISDVRNGAYTAEFHRLTDNKFPLFEGVICKGTANTGAFAGNMWQCKIKTQEYLDSLKNKFGNDWEKYGE